MVFTVQVLQETQADKFTLNGIGVNSSVNKLAANAIKIGKIQSQEEVTSLLDFLKNYTGYVILDFSSLLLGEESLLSYVDVLVFESSDMKTILHQGLNSQESTEAAAKKLLTLGAKSVFLKEISIHASWVHDYWTNGSHSFWLTQKAIKNQHTLETQPVFSTAMAAFLALGYSLQDALIIAKMYLNQTLRLAQETPYYGHFPENEIDIPYLSSLPLSAVPPPFKSCPHLGLYPVVDSYSWVEKLLNYGVKTIQLRIKERTPALEEEVKRSIDFAKKYDSTLFINDYWDLALKYDAEAIHLGQADLDHADLEAIRAKGILLGVSTYCYYEVARAHAIAPSYVAIGPIYPTNSKELEVRAQGVEGLKRWRRTLNYPLVAIGGISLERMPVVVATGVSGVALISAITQAEDPQEATRNLLNCFK